MLSFGLILEISRKIHNLVVLMFHDENDEVFRPRNRCPKFLNFILIPFMQYLIIIMTMW